MSSKNNLDISVLLDQNLSLATESITFTTFVLSFSYIFLPLDPLFPPLLTTLLRYSGKRGTKLSRPPWPQSSIFSFFFFPGPVLSPTGPSETNYCLFYVFFGLSYVSFCSVLLQLNPTLPRIKNTGRRSLPRTSDYINLTTYTF